MKTIRKEASAGFAATNDALVTVSPQDGQGVTVELTSSLQHQFGEYLVAFVESAVRSAGYQGVRVKVIDKGAWDYALKARVVTALTRAETP